MIMEYIPVFLVLVVLAGLFVVVKSFTLPKSFDETGKSRDYIIKQKKKKEELEKLQNNLFEDE